MGSLGLIIALSVVLLWCTEITPQDPRALEAIHAPSSSYSAEAKRYCGDFILNRIPAGVRKSEATTRQLHRGQSLQDFYAEGIVLYYRLASAEKQMFAPRDVCRWHEQTSYQMSVDAMVHQQISMSDAQRADEDAVRGRFRILNDRLMTLTNIYSKCLGERPHD